MFISLKGLFGLFGVGHNKGYLARNSLFAAYRCKSLACSDRASLTDHLNFKVENIAGNHLSAELSLVNTSEQT